MQSAPPDDTAVLAAAVVENVVSEALNEAPAGDSEDAAATAVQAAMRGKQARKEMAEQQAAPDEAAGTDVAAGTDEAAAMDETAKDVAAATIQAALLGTETTNDAAATDEAAKDNAAASIQAAMRGKQARDAQASETSADGVDGTDRTSVAVDVEENGSAAVVITAL